MRGHGDSQWVIGGPYGLPESVADISTLADTLEGPLTIVGHSRGGNVALHYAGAFPDRVARVVAIEGLGPPPPEAGSAAGTAAERMRRWIERMRDMERRRPRRYDNLDDATRRIREEDPRVSPELAHHFAVHGSRRNEDGTYSWKFDNYVRAGGFYGDGGQEVWAGIRAPVLLVTGSESWACDHQWQERRRAIPDHRSVFIEGAGHWVHHDKPERFLETLQAFLAEA
jgi:pimeloyl-ACP methyl ester carboxylesterase